MDNCLFYSKTLDRLFSSDLYYWVPHASHTASLGLHSPSSRLSSYPKWRWGTRLRGYMGPREGNKQTVFTFSGSRMLATMSTVQVNISLASWVAGMYWWRLSVSLHTSNRPSGPDLHDTKAMSCLSFVIEIAVLKNENRSGLRIVSPLCHNHQN